MSDLKTVWNKVEELINDYAKTTFANAAHKVFLEIIDKTPIDKEVTKLNWEIDYGGGFTKSTSSFSNTYKLGNDITIRNQTVYAFMLEYGGYAPGPKTIGGYSKQAPAGMMRIGALKFRQYLKQAKRDYRV